MKCNTCGKVYFYDDNDLKNNSKNGFLTAVSAIGGTGLQTEKDFNKSNNIEQISQIVQLLLLVSSPYNLKD